MTLVTPINKYLTPAAHRLLKALRDGEDKYLIAEGLSVWVDYERFSRATMNLLIRSLSHLAGVM